MKENESGWNRGMFFVPTYQYVDKDEELFLFLYKTRTITFIFL